MTAQQQALAILDRQVTVQSSMLAFSKIYWYSGLVLIGVSLVPTFSCYSETGRARGSVGDPFTSIQHGPLPCKGGYRRSKAISPVFFGQSPAPPPFPLAPQQLTAPAARISDEEREFS